MLGSLRKIYDFAGKNRYRLTRSIVFGVLSSFFNVLMLLAIAVVLSALIDGSIGTGTALLSLAVMIVSICGKFAFGYFGDYNKNASGWQMCADKRIEIGDRMKYMPMGYFNQNNLGKISSAVTTTMFDIEVIAPMLMETVIHGIIHTLILTAAILVFDWRIGLIAVAGIAAFSAVNSLMLRRSHIYGPRRQAAQADLVETTLEYIQGISVLRSFNLAGSRNEKFRNAADGSMNGSLRMEKAMIPLVALQQSVLRVTSAAIILASVLFYLDGTMGLAICVIMVISSFILFEQLDRSGSKASLLRAIDVSIDRVRELDKTPVMDVDGEAITPTDHDIVIRNVDFSYGEKRVLHDINIRIPEGTTTAIVGPSGSGKSTLCKLIARFWDVSGGSITLGGRNVKDYTLDSLLSNISMVFQNVYLFNDTIANNIKFGKPHATMEEVVEAARKACCHDFIMSLDNGYDAVIGEGGATISGGEKQRISIARAILKDAPIILLDEATANVDPENESKLQEAIAELTRDKTIIMIAHRLNTVRNADQIIVLDNGEIVQRGTHDELMGQEGIYADFVNIRREAIGWKLKVRPA
ncbi:ABC transporter ATP-binding protein [Methanomassiliicoccus luminyensis]|uniref:ABC transporter ATP-binding protein n=1 Tax=Methanomassiliicoccus luminyensis TaxID=1080712 RepID=UPI000376966B|nr:ABC transporter ATP-binding protein [Methanomassiliicoccus luminyensis]